MPGGSLLDIYSNYPDAPNPFDVVEGETTVIWGGAGAWAIDNIIENANGTFSYIWGPNVGNLMEGTLSTEGQWQWAVSVFNPNGQWIVSPTYANAATPPEGTVNNVEAINHHPFQVAGEGSAYFSRPTARGENSGWQTACNVGNDATSLLFKDDLIWEQKHGASNLDKLKFYKFDDYFNGIRDVTLDNGKTLYDDIFEDGFIQSVDRVSEGHGDGFKTNWYVIFYNNGNRDSNGDPTEDSNKFFFTHKNNGVQERQNKKVHLLKDVDGPMNLAVLANERKLETFTKNDSDIIRYYFYVCLLYTSPSPRDS